MAGLGGHAANVNKNINKKVLVNKTTSLVCAVSGTALWWWRHGPGACLLLLPRRHQQLEGEAALPTPGLTHAAHLPPKGKTGRHFYLS